MIYIVVFLFLTYIILTHSAVSLFYAFHGLTLWYHKMVPALLPFMILSGTMIRMNLTEKVVLFIHPITKRIFRCNPNISYGILIGFLCGFPMGAKTAADLYREEKITIHEAEFLLSFCNNIGPVYFCSFVIPFLGIENLPMALMGMYGLPFLYGIFLRYTVFRNNIHEVTMTYIYSNESRLNFLLAIDESIKNAIGSISTLCGYMILFNLFNIIPHLFVPNILKYISPLLEITGGITLSEHINKLYILILLPFGGLSCIAQTNSFLQNTELSIKVYVFHKIMLTIISAVYYLMVISYI